MTTAARRGNPLYIWTIDEMWMRESFWHKNTRLPMPSTCSMCRSFDAAVASEPAGSVWEAQRVFIVGNFRIVHHHPKFTFVDRGSMFLQRMRSSFSADLVRDLARFVVMAEQATKQRESTDGD